MQSFAVVRAERSEGWISALRAVRSRCIVGLPKIVKPMRRGSRVVGGMPWIPVPEVVLDQPQVVALVRQGKAAGMTEHVGVHMSKAGAIASRSDDVIDRLSCERLLPLGDEQPG